MKRYDYLIIGGGMTADAAARGIRELDTNGTIGVVSSEPDAPYSRPPLTKALWKGESESSVWRGTESAGVSLHLKRTATDLDTGTRTVIDDAGEQYHYGSLLLATGGTPRPLPFAADGVIYYRSWQDYQRVRALSNENARFAIMGGGFIGSEIAAALAMNGKPVVLIVPEHGIGARVFPADLSRFLATYYRSKGVDVRVGTSVTGVTRGDDGAMIHLEGGDLLEADGVVAGLGITPNVSLAKNAAIRTTDGIVVDDHLRTSADRVYAAGDVANFISPALGERMRVEHEDNALTMGRAAGRAMAGDTATYSHLPFFYSDLFDLGYEAVGRVDSRLETVPDWKEPFREGVVYYLADGRVRGVLLWNVWNQVDAARTLIADPGPFEPDSLKGRIGG